MAQIVGDPKYYGLTTLLPTVPLPVTQCTEVTSRTGNPPVANLCHSISDLGTPTKSCLVPVATLSMKELRLRGSSFIRSHASKHGLPNASRKLMKEVIALLKVHYQEVHHVAMIEDDTEESHHIGGGKKKSTLSIKAKSLIQSIQQPYSILPPSLGTQPMTEIEPELSCLKPVTSLPASVSPTMVKPITASVLDSLVTSAPSAMPTKFKEEFPIVVPMTDLGSGKTCTSRVLARSKAELATFGTSLLRPEAAAHKVHNSSRKPKHVVCQELWSHYVQCHPEELILHSSSEPGWIGNVSDDEDK